MKVGVRECWGFLTGGIPTFWATAKKMLRRAMHLMLDMHYAWAA
jgi:hypothetical protein